MAPQMHNKGFELCARKIECNEQLLVHERKCQNEATENIKLMKDICWRQRADSLCCGYIAFKEKILKMARSSKAGQKHNSQIWFSCILKAIKSYFIKTSDFQ